MLGRFRVRKCQPACCVLAAGSRNRPVLSYKVIVHMKGAKSMMHEAEMRSWDGEHGVEDETSVGAIRVTRRVSSSGSNRKKRDNIGVFRSVEDLQRQHPLTCQGLLDRLESADPLTPGMDDVVGWIYQFEVKTTGGWIKTEDPRRELPEPRKSLLTEIAEAPRTRNAWGNFIIYPDRISFLADREEVRAALHDERLDLTLREAASSRLRGSLEQVIKGVDKEILAKEAEKECLARLRDSLPTGPSTK